ncbi:MAG: ATP-binding protein [Nakamurella sp.]
MQSSKEQSSSAVRSLHLCLLALAVAVVAIGTIEIAMNLVEPVGPAWAIVAFTGVAWVYAGAGLVAWWRRPSSRIGALMLFCAACWLAAGLLNTDVPVLVTIGLVSATVPLAAAVHLLHAFPTGRLSGPAARITVVAGYVVAGVLQAPLYLFEPNPPPYDLLFVADRPDLLALGAAAQQLAGAAVMIATTVLLALRVRAAEPARRRVLLPLFSYGIFAVLAVPLTATVITPLLGLTPVGQAVFQLAIMAGLPIVFTLGVLSGRFAKTGEIEELGTWLGAADGSRPALVDALAKTLGDPSLRLAFWVPELSGYVDAAGSPIIVAASSQERSVVEINLADHRVGAIIYDPVLVADPELVRAAGRVVAIAADRERLTAELRSSREALRLSRARIADAGDRERRRVARDLHDGLQVQLLILAVQAQEIASTHPVAALEAVALRVGIDAAAADLRGVVQSIMPSALIERGLSAATEDLVDRLPLHTQLDIDMPDTSLPEFVENAAYFIVAEGLANALKHSNADELSVRMAHTKGRLTVEVSDDGVGGAELATGSGLRGLMDRTDVIGGILQVTSPVGHGTRLVAELPCGC